MNAVYRLNRINLLDLRKGNKKALCPLAVKLSNWYFTALGEELNIWMR